MFNCTLFKKKLKSQFPKVGLGDQNDWDFNVRVITNIINENDIDLPIKITNIVWFWQYPVILIRNYEAKKMQDIN